MLAIAAAVTLGFSASAQKTNAKGDRTARTEQTDKMYRPQKFTDYAFEGILLDINQQARVDSLNAAYKANGKCDRSECKSDKKCADKKQCADTTKCAGKVKCNERVKCSDQRKFGDRMKARKEYIAKVKEILTPEQYTLFLENIVNMPEPRGLSRSNHLDSKHMKKDGGKYKKADDTRSMKERTR